jgi:transposase
VQFHDVTEAEWRHIAKLFPRSGSMKAVGSGAARGCINGILWRMRTGQPWKCLPPEYGNYKYICRRFGEWRETGVWRNVAAVLAEMRGAKGPRNADRRVLPDRSLDPRPLERATP